MQIYIITGMAGAGKSTVLDTFEDRGYYCIDNLPPSLLLEFLRLHSLNEDQQNVAVVMDLRLGSFFNDILSTIKKIKEIGHEVKIIFVEADEQSLKTRFSTVRRSHPFENGLNISDAIDKEREKLKELRENSNWIVDTSKLNAYELKKKTRAFFEEKAEMFEINITSFGIKHGMIDMADYIFDLRSLKNPFYEEELKEKTGHEKEVRDYVLSGNDALELLEAIKNMLTIAVRQYENTARDKIHIAFYCTGGRHRSVTFGVLVKKYFEGLNYKVHYQDRDLR